MTRINIIKSIVLKFALEETAVENFVDAVTGKMLEAFRKGKGVNIPEFGKFFVVPKTVGGVKVNTVAFSPARKFADSVNDDFSDLVPEIISAGSLKVKNEIRVAEVPYEIEGMDFTYFVFDEAEIQEQVEIQEPEEVSGQTVTLKEEETLPAEQESVEIPEDKQTETKEIDLQTGEDQLTPAITAEAETEKITVIETEPSLPEKQPVSDESGYFVQGEVPVPTEPGLIAQENEQDNLIDEKVITEVQQESPEPESLDADENRDIIIPGDISEENTNKEEDIILIDVIPAQKTGMDLDAVGPGHLFPDVLKDETTAYEIEREILDLLKEREDLIASLNLFESVSAPEKDVSSVAGETVLEEEIAQETESAEKTFEAVLPGETEITPAEEIIIPPSVEPGEEIYLEEGIYPEEEIYPDEEIHLEEEIYPEEDVLQELPPEAGYEEAFPVETEDIKESIEELPPVEETTGELISESELDDEVKKRIDELEQLARIRDELQKEAVLETGNKEMQVFEKLIDETETDTETEIIEIPETIIREPEEEEPASLSDALQEIDHEDAVRQTGAFEETKDDNVKSYEDVFDTAEQHVVPQFLTDEGRKLTPQSYLKFFLYLFFIFLLATFSFYMYKKILMVPDSPSLVDTTGTSDHDSLKTLITGIDSAEMQEEGISMLEDIEVERDGNIIYRKMNDEYRIQISVFQNLADAEKFIMNLKEKNFDAKIERADMPMGRTEYRIVVGTFTTLDEAKSYYNSRSMILNFIKVLTPANSGLYPM